MSHQLTSSQLRASRALLNWSRAELASHSGVSEQTIHRLENNMGEPEARTQNNLRRILEHAGIEFTTYNGVRFRPEGVDVLDGHDGLTKFFDGVYEYARLQGGLIRQSGVDEALFTKHLGNYSAIHIDRMSRLAKERDDVHMHAIIREGDINFECVAYTDYRWYPKQFFSCAPFYLYGDMLGIMTFQTDPAPKIIYIRSNSIAEAYRLQFDDMWGRSKIPPKGQGSRQRKAPMRFS